MSYKLLSVLPATDKALIDEYRYMYGGVGCRRDEMCDTDTFLNEWAKQKDALYHLLGEKLTIEKPVELEVEPGYIQKVLENESSGSAVINHIFLEKFDKILYDVLPYIGWNENDHPLAKIYGTATKYQEARHLAFELGNSKVLSESKYNGKKFSLYYEEGNKKIRIIPGMKTMKIFHKLNEAFHFASAEEEEDFRVKYSMLFNTKKFKGTLCVSIHPMDYMTMSDNDSNWSSCMSWQDEGCYRRGTLAMMNSSNVVVAYLKSDDKDFCFNSSKGFYWNNKKWRSLFVCDNAVLTSVKNYPYYSPILNEAVLDMLQELYKKNWGIDLGKTLRTDDNYLYFNKSEDYDERTGGYFHFHSGFMYNDFGTTTHHYRINTLADHDEIYEIEYYGHPVCVRCGGYEFSNDDYGDEVPSLVCNECEPTDTCQYCGGRIRYNDECHCAVGYDTICDCCFEDHFRYIDYLDDYYCDDDLEQIYLGLAEEDGTVKGSSISITLPSDELFDIICDKLEIDEDELVKIKDRYGDKYIVFSKSEYENGGMDNLKSLTDEYLSDTWFYKAFDYSLKN